MTKGTRKNSGSLHFVSGQQLLLYVVRPLGGSIGDKGAPKSGWHVSSYYSRLPRCHVDSSRLRCAGGIVFQAPSFKYIAKFYHTKLATAVSPLYSNVSIANKPAHLAKPPVPISQGRQGAEMHCRPARGCSQPVSSEEPASSSEVFAQPRKGASTQVVLCRQHRMPRRAAC